MQRLEQGPEVLKQLKELSHLSEDQFLRLQREGLGRKTLLHGLETGNGGGNKQFHATMCNFNLNSHFFTQEQQWILLWT